MGSLTAETIKLLIIKGILGARENTAKIAVELGDAFVWAIL